MLVIRRLAVVGWLGWLIGAVQSGCSGSATNPGAGGAGSGGGGQQNGGAPAGATSTAGASNSGGAVTAGGNSNSGGNAQAGSAAGGLTASGGAGGALTSSGGRSTVSAGAGGDDSTSGGAAGAGEAGGGAGSSTAAGSGGTDGGSASVGPCDTDTKPTVYVMVDRSGSMFDCLSTELLIEPACEDAADTAWSVLKASVLAAIQQREAQIKFGFLAFTGTNPQLSGMCPILDEVEPGIGNHSKISQLYDKLGFSPEQAMTTLKLETPTLQALEHLGAKLATDASPGKKSILLVTDGQPDFCDDEDSICPVDAVVGKLQALYAQGISTTVIGLRSRVRDVPETTLEAFANAGAGEDTVDPAVSTTGGPMTYDLCQLSSPTWRELLVASGKPLQRGSTLGNYASAAGPTQPFIPSIDDPQALSAALAAALEVSCDD